MVKQDSEAKSIKRTTLCGIGEEYWIEELWGQREWSNTVCYVRGRGGKGKSKERRWAV